MFSGWSIHAYTISQPLYIGSCWKTNLDEVKHVMVVVVLEERVHYTTAKYPNT